MSVKGDPPGTIGLQRSLRLCRPRHFAVKVAVRFGLGGVVLGWIRSFLTDRSQCVSSGGCLSLLTVLCFGIGLAETSVLGPLLFLLYTAKVFGIIAFYALTGHADE